MQTLKWDYLPHRLNEMTMKIQMKIYGGKLALIPLKRHF